MKDVLFQGAESRIFVDEYLGKKMLIKERFKKEYRVSELDDHLTKERIKAECRNNIRCKQAGIKTPAIYFVDVNKRLIYMEYFDKSITVKAYIQEIEKKLSDECYRTDLEEKLANIANQIGEVIGKMHKHGIIHGDLTTSNFLLRDKESKEEDNLVLIDFGLSQSDGSEEDKAVDLYVLEKALVSTHLCTEKLFTNILKSYCKSYGDESKDFLKKFGEVRSRGRKRTMVG